MPTRLHAGKALALLAFSLCASLQAQPAATEPGAAESGAPSAKVQSSTPQPSERPQEDPGQLEAESRQAYEDGDYLKFYIANMKLHERFPFVPQYMANIVRACALLEKSATAYHYMHKMQQQGLSYDFNQFEDTESIRNTQAYDYINNLLIDAGAPAGEGAVAATLAGNPADYSAITWDGSRDRLLVGTLRDGRILAVDRDGDAEVLLQANADNGFWSVNGLAVDEARKRLWVSSAATPAFAGYEESVGNRNAVFEFDLETLERLGRYDLPADGLYHELGGLAVTGDGQLYVIDTVRPVVYRKHPDQPRLEPFVASTELVAFTDVAVAPDNSRLFASDPVMGIFLVDPVAQAAAMLSGPETLNLGGIQSVDYRDGNLFVVQAGIQPERLTRLELDDAGASVVQVTPLAVALDAFERPGQGTVAGGDIYYFANPGAGEDAAGAVVMRTPLDAGSALKSFDIEDLQKALKPREP